MRTTNTFKIKISYILTICAFAVLFALAGNTSAHAQYYQPDPTVASYNSGYYSDSYYPNTSYSYPNYYNQNYTQGWNYTYPQNQYYYYPYYYYVAPPVYTYPVYTYPTYTYPQYTNPYQYSAPYVAPLSVTCWPNATRAAVGAYVTWASTVTGGSGSNTYYWVGRENGYSTANSNLMSTSYSTPGPRTASITVISGNQTVTQNCGTIYIGNQYSY